MEQTTVSTDINEGDNFIDVVDASGVTEWSYVEIDLREQDIVSPYSTLVKQAAALENTKIAKAADLEKEIAKNMSKQLLNLGGS